jgi:hypothetical protein
MPDGIFIEKGNSLMYGFSVQLNVPLDSAPGKTIEALKGIGSGFRMSGAPAMSKE